MAQYGRPISDISTGGWGTTPLWSKLDDNDDADYITSAKNPSADTFENALTSTLSDPSSSSGHIIRARLRCDKANNGTANLYLYQGTTLIASYAIPGNLATAFTTYSYTLTGTEADSITDYTALRIRVDGSGTANAYVFAAWTELEIPDASSATEESVTLTIYKGISEVNNVNVQGASSLAKFVGIGVSSPGELHRLDFEEGDLTDWDADSGAVAVNGSAAMVGSYGTAFTNSGDGGNDYGEFTQASYVGATNLRFRFYFDPNSVAMSDADNFWLGWARDASANMYYEIRFQYTTDHYEIRVAVKDDSYTTIASSYYTVSDGPHWIEVRIQKASTDSASDGLFQWFLDDSSQELVTGIDLYDVFENLDNHRFGFVTSVETTTSGTIYIDDIIVRNDDTYIGPATTPTEESVTLTAYKGISDTNYASVPGASSLAKFVGESAASLTNVQESVLQAKKIYTVSASNTAESELVSLAKSVFLTVSEQIWVAPVEEAVSLSRALGLSPSLVLDIYQSVNLSRFAGVTQISQAVVNDFTSLNRINTIPAGSLGTLYDLINLGHTDGLTVLEETQGQTEESVVLAIFKGITQNSQVNVNDSTSLNRINTIPTATLGTIFDLIGLNHTEGLTVLEEAQGAVYETVILNRLMGIASSSLGITNESANLAIFKGLSGLQQLITSDSVNLDTFYGLNGVELLESFEAIPLARANATSLATNVVIFDDVSLLMTLLIFAQPTSNFEILNVGDANVYAVRFRDKRFGVIFRDKRAKGGS